MKGKRLAWRGQDGVLHQVKLGGDDEALEALKEKLTKLWNIHFPNKLEYEEAVAYLGSSIGKMVGKLNSGLKAMGVLSAYVPGRGQRPLSEDVDDVELMVYVSDRDITELDGSPYVEEAGEKLLLGVDLVTQPDEKGERSAVITIDGVEGSFTGRTTNSAHIGGTAARSITTFPSIPVDFSYTKSATAAASGKQGLVKVTVTPKEASAPAKNYVILVYVHSSKSDIEQITYTSSNRAGQLQYGADGAQETLTLEEARARYNSMPHSAPMDETEESRYFDPDTGKAIQRIVYRGWLTSSDLAASKLRVYIKGTDPNSTAQLWINNPVKPLKTGSGRTRYGTFDEKYITESDRTFIQPLLDAQGTEDWDKVYVRIYGQIMAEDGTMESARSYAVLELGIARKGNYKLARVETDAEGSVVKDAAGEVKLVPAGQKTLVNDTFGVWVHEIGTDYRDCAPNAVVAPKSSGEIWDTTANDNPVELEGQGGDYDPVSDYFDVGLPQKFKASISGDATDLCVTVKAEDPYSYVGIGYVAYDGDETALYISDYKLGGNSRELHFTAGQPGTVYIHVRSQNLGEPVYNFRAGNPLYGRLYVLELEVAENE